MLNANMISGYLVITHMCTYQRDRINVHWPNGSHCHTQVAGSAFKKENNSGLQQLQWNLNTGI